MYTRQHLFVMSSCCFLCSRPFPCDWGWELLVHSWEVSLSEGPAADPSGSAFTPSKSMPGEGRSSPCPAEGLCLGLLEEAAHHLGNDHVRHGFWKAVECSCFLQHPGSAPSPAAGAPLGLFPESLSCVPQDNALMGMRRGTEPLQTSCSSADGDGVMERAQERREGG